jgi:hypothetical protein
VLETGTTLALPIVSAATASTIASDVFMTTLLPIVYDKDDPSNGELREF